MRRVGGALVTVVGTLVTVTKNENDLVPLAFGQSKLSGFTEAMEYLMRFFELKNSGRLGSLGKIFAVFLIETGHGLDHTGSTPGNIQQTIGMFGKSRLIG